MNVIFKLAAFGWIRGVFFLAIGLAAGWIASVTWPFSYTSVATIRWTHGVVPQELIPRQRVDAKALLDELAPEVFSNSAIEALIDEHDLYPAAIASPEAAVAKFRRSARVETDGASLIRVAFTYGELASGEENARRAQAVVKQLVAGLIDRNIRNQANAEFASTGFFEDAAETAGKDLVKAEARLRATPASDPQYPVAALDRDLKRKEYEAIGQKRAEAGLLSALGNRKEGQNLELLDPASLAGTPDTSPWFPRVAGVFSGLAAWLLIECRPGRLRGQRAGAMEPEASLRVLP